MKIRQAHQKAFSQIETPVWNRVALPNRLFPTTYSEVNATLTSSSDKVAIVPFETYVDSEQAIEWLEECSKKNLGKAFIHYINGFYNTGYVIKSTSKALEPPLVKLKYQFGKDGQPLVDNHLIVAEAGARLDLVLDYHMAEDLDSDKDESQYAVHYGITRIVARPGSHVRVFKLQRLNDISQHFDQVFTSVAEGGLVDIYDVQMGSQFKAISYETDLEGRHSEANIKNIYFGDQNSRSDLSFTMNHFGKKSNSSILSKGALDTNALKVFRGNLFFNTGASQSVGKEEEFVMLLGDTIKSDSIPALMCSEDDVIGEHAASVGQVDQNKLFYLMSRGFSEKEAKKLVIKASYEEILSNVPYASFREIVSEEVDRRVV